MRKTLQIITFLFSIANYACICNDQSITEKYIQSEFVAKVKIIKNYKNVDSKEIYKADIIINELYKGESLKSIYINGRSDGNMGSSCSIFIPENTELIIYAQKNNNGKYTIGMCSGLLYLKKSNLKKQVRELEILKIFKTQGINLTDKINYREKGTLSKKLEEFKGIKLDKEYGIYEINFDSNLKITNVKQISGFENPIDKKLMDILSTTEWTRTEEILKNEVTENRKLIIGIYFYKSEKENSSFLSQFYL
ncbi:hypothetical protein MW871_15980 [Flavobacterium sp. I-SCBP12n]|uniref:Tissue inhibitor of metalloproteinase n=1 Tax=Flavobacterium pygoscelis TaxID=2893176 RepID=A0A9X1XVB3_9FLAO|nr:hypothetical protein [Flavobacterium pygoscelis]MCK8143329.1 hypothetical protein [Flavobacterium pygoscelis]MCK8143391.1 hypothetical protein [Flavobacterium pygoscelis]